MMSMMQKQGGAQMPPVSAPMSTPQDNAGDKQGAMAQVQMATKILEQTLAAFGSQSDEGKAVLDALKGLGKAFGETADKGRDLIPAEIMNMVASMPKSAQAQMQPPGGGQQQPPMQ
jgi:uncharacterized membrane protein YdfJ with MMPL/SSD domain